MLASAHQTSASENPDSAQLATDAVDMELAGRVLHIWLRAVERTLRQRSPGAPATARFGAVSFIHRFGSALNAHLHYLSVPKTHARRGPRHGTGFVGCNFRDNRAQVPGEGPVLRKNSIPLAVKA